MKPFHNTALKVLSVIIFLSFFGNIYAQDLKSDARKDIHEKLSQFAKSEVFPSLRQWKSELDGAMNPADLASLNDLRSQATELRNQARTYTKSMAASWKNEDYAELKSSRNSLKSLAEKRDKLFAELKPIAVKYSSTLKSIGEVAKPKVEAWKEKGREIVKKWAESHKDELKDGKHFQKLGGFFKQFAGGDKRKAIARFMLWNGDENIIEEHGQLTPEMMNSNSEGMLEPTNAPNPFESNTAINFSLAKADKVSLKVFDLKGNIIQTIVDGNLSEGEHSYTFTPIETQSVSGIYFYRLETSSGIRQKTMEFIR